MAQSPVIKVLVVEDDDDFRDLIISLLEESVRVRFVPASARDSQEALMHARKGVFDLILCDYRLPDMSGTDLFAEIRKMSHMSRTPFVLVTSLKDPLIKETARAVGIEHFFEKKSLNQLALEQLCLTVVARTENDTSLDPQGVGILMRELVELTRSSVYSQNTSSNAIQGLVTQVGGLRTDVEKIHEDLTEKVDAIHKNLTEKVEALKEHTEAQKIALVAELNKGPWGLVKQMVSWGIQNPVYGLVILLIVLLLCIIVGVFFVTVDMTALGHLFGK